MYSPVSIQSHKRQSQTVTVSVCPNHHVHLLYRIAFQTLWSSLSHQAVTNATCLVSSERKISRTSPFAPGSTYLTLIGQKDTHSPPTLMQRTNPAIYNLLLAASFLLPLPPCLTLTLHTTEPIPKLGTTKQATRNSWLPSATLRNLSVILHPSNCLAWASRLLVFFPPSLQFSFIRFPMQDPRVWSGEYVLFYPPHHPQTNAFKWFVCSFFLMFIALAMAELGSSAPTCGGIYYWTFKFSSERYRNYLCWIVGCAFAVYSHICVTDSQGQISMQSHTLLV